MKSASAEDSARLANTPAAWTAAATAKAGSSPACRPMRDQTATEGAAAAPKASHTAVSSGRRTGFAPHHVDDEGGRDHVAEAEQRIGDHEGEGDARGALVVGRTRRERRSGRKQGGGTERTESGTRRRAPPQGPPVLGSGTEQRHEAGRDHDPDPHAGIMEGRRTVSRRSAKGLENDRRGEDETEGARRAADRAQEKECGEGLGEPHRGRRERHRCQRGHQDRTRRRGQSRRTRQQGSRKVTCEIGARHEARLAPGPAERLRHGGQDRRVDEAADAHGGSERETAAERDAPRPRRRAGHQTATAIAGGAVSFSRQAET